MFREIQALSAVETFNLGIDTLVNLDQTLFPRLMSTIEPNDIRLIDIEVLLYLSLDHLSSLSEQQLTVLKTIIGENSNRDWPTLPT